MNEYIKAYLQSLQHTFEECEASYADLKEMHVKMADMIHQYNMMNNQIHQRLERCKHLAYDIGEEAALAGDSKTSSEAKEIYNIVGKMCEHLPRNAYVEEEFI